VVGQGQRFHAIGASEGKELFKTNSAIQEAILTMEMQMDKFFHGAYQLFQDYRGLPRRLSLGSVESLSMAFLKRRGLFRHSPHSHSIVLGGLELISYTTRFTPCTSLMMRFAIKPKSSYGILTQSAVMPSRLETARKAITCS